MERRYSKYWLKVLIVALLYGASPASSQDLLGTAEAFAVLGASTVTNTGDTVITGDLGLSPGVPPDCAITGFPPGVVNGTTHACDAVASAAQDDVTIAYDDLATRTCDVDLSGDDLGGLTLTSGVYCFSSDAQLTGILSLDAEGNPDAEFVFQIGSTLTTASDSTVLVINSGLECNVYWQVGSSATLGTNTTFVGNILALASITLNTTADLSGRALARTGAVTLDTNEVSLPRCGPCLLAVRLDPSTVYPGDLLDVEVYLQHKRPKTVTKRFGLAIEDAQGALVDFRWTDPVTIAHGDEFRGHFEFLLPPDLVPGNYGLRIWVAGMRQGVAWERAIFRVVSVFQDIED